MGIHGSAFTNFVSGSDKWYNVGGIETQGDLGVTGSVQVSGSLNIGASALNEERVATHPLTVRGDMSGSGKLFNVAGIETQGNLSVTGSVLGTSIGYTNLVGNPGTLSSDITLLAGYNALLYGPFTVAADKTLTIPADATVKIKNISDV